MAAFSPEAHYTFFFPPVLIAKLDALLAAAKELAKDPEVKLRLAQFERNYLYNRDIAAVFHFSRAYQMQPSWELFKPLARAIKTRNARGEQKEYDIK